MGKSLNDRVNGLMKRGYVFRLFAAATMAACCGWAEERADFLNGIGTNGWTIGAYEWTSPSYGNAVDLIRLEYGGVGSAKVYARPETGGESLVATLASASSAATFEFPESTAFRSFKIVVATGTWNLDAFSAVLSAASLPVPTDVVISNNITGTSFDAYWNAVEGATGYRVYVWTNAVVGASAGTEVWQESFTNSPAKSNSTAFSVSYTDSGKSDWTFDKVYAHSEAGMVRIGNTSAKGVLVSPALGDVVIVGDPLTLRVRVCKQESKDGDFMPIGIVSGDITNILEVLEITTTPTEYQIDLPTLSATDRLAFLSPTNKSSARAILDDVAIVSGYSEGHEEPAYIVNDLDVGNVAEYSFSGLPSVPVSFAVEAYGRRGVLSSKTEAVVVDLANPDKVAQLNACPLSSLDGNVYTQDFDSLAPLTETTGDKEWLNGTTLQYWQGYKNYEPITKFTYNGGAENSAGLYALASDRKDSVRTLGAYSTQNDEFSFGLAFTNDTDKTMRLSSVAYLAQQWGFKNDTNQTMSVSVKVVNDLDWISAYNDEWTELGSTQSAVYGAEDVHDTPVSTPVAATPAEEISVAPGQVLMIKWTIHSLKSGKPGMMGIDNVTVEFAPVSVPKGFSIHIAGNSAIP